MKKSDVASIFLLILLLSFAVVIVDGRWLRVAIAVVPALLLAQQGLRASEREEAAGEAEGWTERRSDIDMRRAVDELLHHIREFYLTCHMLGTGRLSADDAVERAAQQELELNQLLARVTDGAKARSKR